MSQIAAALRESDYNGFPIIEIRNEKSRVVGMITRHVLMNLLEKLHSIEDCAAE